MIIFFGSSICNFDRKVLEFLLSVNQGQVSCPLYSVTVIEED